MENKLCDITKELCRQYLLYPKTADIHNMSRHFDEHLIFIGTGKQEFYTSLSALCQIMAAWDIPEDITLKIIDEHYECRMLSEHIYLVYGSIWIKEQDAEDKEILIEMDTRFSIIYEVSGDSLKVVHVHHSVPYSDQGHDEYYPKTFSEKANSLIAEFKKRAESDSMTGLLNHTAFEQYISSQIKYNRYGVFYMIDIDHFKLINDEYGHDQGDLVIKDFARLLSDVFYKNAYIGRLGGDEFAVFEAGMPAKEDICFKASRLIDKFSSCSGKYGTKLRMSCSIGISLLGGKRNDFKSLYRAADKNLYISKERSRGTYHMDEDI